MLKYLCSCLRTTSPNVHYKYTRGGYARSPYKHMGNTVTGECENCCSVCKIPEEPSKPLSCRFPYNAPYKFQIRPFGTLPPEILSNSFMAIIEGSLIEPRPVNKANCPIYKTPPIIQGSSRSVYSVSIEHNISGESKL